MPTNVTGRMGTRSTSNTFSLFTGGSTTFSRPKANKRGGAGTSKASAAGGAGYKSCAKTFQNKIQSFKTLVSQTTGPAKSGRPTPATLNSFANWINKGAVIQTVSPNQVARWAKATGRRFNGRIVSTTACKNVLCAKFGKNAIKAVARAKNGSFMVATAPVVKGKPFNFPK